jgi:hypothetical protein
MGHTVICVAVSRIANKEAIVPDLQNPRVDIETVSEDKFVKPSDGHDHGYWGFVPDETPNEDYTVAGVVGGTSNASDKPSGAAKERAERNTDALKGGK